MSLSYLVPEKLGPKVGLIFHQNVLFSIFKHFVCINFLLHFGSNWLPFSLIFDFYDPHFNKTIRWSTSEGDIITHQGKCATTMAHLSIHIFMWGLLHSWFQTLMPCCPLRVMPCHHGWLAIQGLGVFHQIFDIR